MIKVKVPKVEKLLETNIKWQHLNEMERRNEKEEMKILGHIISCTKFSVRNTYF